MTTGANTITVSAAATAVAWVPSQDRTIIVPAMSSANVRGIAASTASTFTMAPVQAGSDLDFSFDVSANIAFGDTIETVVASVAPTTLTIVFAGGTGSLATIWVKGLVAGQAYLFSVTIVTRQGRTIHLSATLTVPGFPSVPGTVTVVTVPQSYVDNAVGTEAAIRAASMSGLQSGLASEATTRAAADTAISAAAAQRANNLSDLASTNSARENLGLGDAAVLNVGTIAGTVADGGALAATAELASAALPAASLPAALAPYAPLVAAPLVNPTTTTPPQSDSSALVPNTSWVQSAISAVSGGYAQHASVSAVATGNVSLAAPGATIDGVTLVTGNRILLTGQTTASQNGYWVWTGSAAALTRPADWASGSTQGGGKQAVALTLGGTVNAGISWACTTTGAIVVDTTATAWTQSSFQSPIIAGQGLQLTGGVLALANAYTVPGAVIPGTTIAPLDLLLDGHNRVIQASDTGTLYQAASTGLVAAPNAAALAATNATISTETAARAALIETATTVIPNPPETLAEIVLDEQNRVVQARGDSGAVYLPVASGLDAVVTKTELTETYQGRVFVPGFSSPVSVTLDSEYRVTEMLLESGTSYTQIATGLDRVVTASQVPDSYTSAAVVVPGFGPAADVTIDPSNRVTNLVTSSGSSYGATAAGLVAPSASAQNPLHFDVVVYGGTIGGIMAAYRASVQYGLRVCIIEATHWLGGASAAVGLSFVDQPATPGQIGGDTYNTWFGTIVSIDGSSAHRYQYEPKTGQQTANQLAAKAAVLSITDSPIYGPSDLLISTGLLGVTILGIMTRVGLVTGTQFIDASYEADLGIAALGMSYFTIGRESTATYGESAAGFQPGSAATYAVSDNQYYPVIPTITGTTGQADNMVQSWGFRGALTRTAGNVIPFFEPPGYNNQNYIAQLGIYADQGITAFARPVSNQVFYQGGLPNGKIAVNGGDLPNYASAYCSANWNTRKGLMQQLGYYYMGLLYCIQSDPLTATLGLSALQADSQGCGYCADEFVGSPFGNGVPMWGYLREGPRFTGAALVITQAYTTGSGIAVSDPVCTYNYAQDFHNGHLYAVNASSNSGVVSEGFPPLSGAAPVVGMSARTMQTAVGGSPNLQISTAFGASHIGWGPLRLEPNFGMMGEGAGVIAAQSVLSGAPVQGFNYSAVAAALTARGSIL